MPRTHHKTATAAQSDDTGDPLGPVLKTYRPQLGSAVFAIAITVALGGGLLGYAISIGKATLVSLLVGGFGLVLCLVGGYLLFVNLANLGRRLDLHKRGIRFSQFGFRKQMRWKEIVNIDVERREVEAFGIMRSVTTSDDEYSPEAATSNTSWEIAIESARGQTIVLGEIFMRIVPDPPQLIANLRKGAKLTKEMQQHAGY